MDTPKQILMIIVSCLTRIGPSDSRIHRVATI